ncbi:MAG TPA: zf-HC2 domain-containing protein [Polyangia bacterium]
MSETTTNTSGTCELVLDYVYGELDEARKKSFEEHLPTCASCQREVASFGKVRAAVKRVMPAAEPPASLGGALHAQLMHAAAQRKPRRGILLAFPRKIMEHPALSAAAMFVLVGGAIAINWSHGKLAMPAAEHAETDAPKPTESPKVEPEVAAAAPATPAPPVAEPMPAAKEKEGGKAENALYKGGDFENKPAADKTQIALQTPSGPMTVERPVAHHPSGTATGSTATGSTATAAPKKAAPARMKNIAVDGKMAKYDSTLDDALGSKDEGASVGGVVGGSAGGGRGVAANERAKSSAPEELAPETVLAEKAPAKRAHAGASADQSWRNAPPAAPPPPTAAAPSTVTSTPAASTRDNGYFARSQAQTGAPAVQKPSSSSRSFDLLRKQADEFAKTGRCEEAMKLYQELENAKQYLSPTERVSWVRCLMQKGRQEEAQQRLDELKQEKKVTNSQIQDAERELNDSRRKVEAKKAKKAPAPADRAPATESVQQRRAADEQPAQAAPPDSTNTKVKPSSSY